MSWGALIGGLKTYLPGKRFATRTGGTISARYCYSVWLRHLTMARQNGLDTHPRVIAELGPGDSLGIGLAALISGCERYFALDLVEFAEVDRNLAVFDEIASLFREREPIPGEDEFPGVWPRLETYEFPSEILEQRLPQAMESARMEEIRRSIQNPARQGSMFEYRVPWCDATVIENESVDMIYSQAVLEHVDDLRGAYRAMGRWLKPTGFMSHTIDFRCHGTANSWNGHWAYSDFTWKIIKGRRPYLLNRKTHSAHLALMEANGFRIVCDKKAVEESRLKPAQLAREYRALSGDDMITSVAFILAVKNARDDVADPIDSMNRHGR